MIRGWLRITSFLIAVVWTTPLFAQAAVLQGGPTTPGHVPMYVGQGSQQPIVQDSGPAGGGAVGYGLSELNVTSRGTGNGPFPNSGSGPFYSHGCFFDTFATSPSGYHYLCFDPNATIDGVQGAQIVAGAAGSAAPLPFQWCVNGTCYTPGGATAGISVGSTTVTGGTTNCLLYDPNGVLGCVTTLPSGTAAVTQSFNSGDTKIATDAYADRVGTTLLSTNNSWSGDQYFGSGRPWFDIRAFGAVGNNSTDDHTAIQNAINAASAVNGEIFVPIGQYCNNETLTVSGGSVNFVGASRIGSTISNCNGSNVGLIHVLSSSGFVVFQNLSLAGANITTASHPTLQIDGPACKISFVTIYYGNEPFYNHSGDCYAIDSWFTQGYTANLLSDAGASYFMRQSLDQPTVGSGSPCTSAAAWSSITSVTAGECLTVSSTFVVQYLTSGTTGASAPTIAPYLQTVIDGTATEQLLAKSNFIGAHFAVGSVVNYLDTCDLTGYYNYGIQSEANGLNVSNCTLNTFGTSVFLDGGNSAQFTNNYVQGNASTSNGIVSNGFSGELTITDNKLYLTAANAVYLLTGSNVILHGNQSGGSNAGLVAAGALHVLSTGNNWGGGTDYGANTFGISISSTTDYFQSVNDDVKAAGTPYTNTASGTHNSVIALAGYTGAQNFLQPTLFGIPATIAGNGQATVGQSTTLGAVLQGQGSTNDVTLAGTAGDVCGITHGNNFLTCNSLALITPLSAGEGGTGAAVLPTGAVKANGTAVSGQAACSDLSNAGTACADNTGTSGATIPLLNGNNTESGNNTHTGTETFQSQIIPAYGTPTIASGACGATTNGTLAAGSTNQAGQVQIASATTTTCTISFSATLAAAPLACVLFPANAAAAATGTTVARVSSISTSAWVITGSALASANYYYHCF